MTFAAWGGLIIVLGVAGWMYADSRVFRRTNAAGVEVFSGYFSMVLSRFFEGALRLFGKLSFFLGLVAVALGPNKQPRLGHEAKLPARSDQMATAKEHPTQKPRDAYDHTLERSSR